MELKTSAKSPAPHPEVRSPAVNKEAVLGGHWNGAKLEWGDDVTRVRCKNWVWNFDVQNSGSVTKLKSEDKHSGWNLKYVWNDLMIIILKFKVYKVAVFRTVQHVIKFTLCVHLNGSRWTLVGFCALYQILLHLPSPSIERWRAAKLHEGMRTDAWQITHCSQSPWTLQDFSGKVKNTAR